MIMSAVFCPMSEFGQMFPVAAGVRKTLECSAVMAFSGHDSKIAGPAWSIASPLKRGEAEKKRALVL